MGCDIHAFAEKRKDKKAKWVLVTDVFPLSDFDKDWYKKEKGDHPFDWRQYGMYGFLADVRNYSHVPVIAEPKWVIPEDATKEVKEEFEKWNGDAHTATWLTAKQLLDFDYDQVFWDKRVTRDGDGAAEANEGEGEHLTIREFLGEEYFEHLETLKSLGDPENVRVIFWFDN